MIVRRCVVRGWENTIFASVEPDTCQQPGCRKQITVCTRCSGLGIERGENALHERWGGSILMRCDAVHHADCVRRVALARAVGFLGRQRSAETGGSAQPSFVRRAWLQFLTRSAGPALRFVADPEMSVNVMCCMDTIWCPR